MFHITLPGEDNVRLAAILQALVALRRSLSTGLPILQFLAEIAYYTIQDTLFVFFLSI